MPYLPTVAIRNAFSRPCRFPAISLLTSLLFFANIISCSSSPPKRSDSTARPTATPRSVKPQPAPDVRWTLYSARRQTSFVSLDLPLVLSGTKITISQPTGSSEWVSASNASDGFNLFTTHVSRGEISGPAVEQLTGFPQTSSDTGSYLVELPREKHPADSGDQMYTVTTPFPLYLQVDVSALQDPGDYVLPITIAAPNRPVERAGLAIHVSDVALPTEPRILAVATTTTADLARVLPDSFAGINAIYLDRTDPDDHLAVQHLDALVCAAQKRNLALFVEDIGPRVRVDEVGRVSIDWSAYDRLVQPYMDGSAFEDRVPLSVWLAPLPPRRISDSPTQLRQYIAACAQHFTEKGWTATPAFLHPALVNSGGGDADPQVREEIAKTLRLHMTRDFLAVTTPEAPVPQPRLWTIDDSDPRLPPAGALATEESVRVWPWVCAARSDARDPSASVRGFVWRNALERSDLLQAARAETAIPERPLLVFDLPAKANPAALSIVPSLRMVWLNEGLNDTALLGLLEQRTDRDVVDALIAGLVGRTGTSTAPPASSDIPLPAPGYLYASWPEDKTVWGAIPALLERLLQSTTPGQDAKLSQNDPAYLAAQVWLAKSRRPVARLAGYGFAIKPGRDGDALLITPHLFAENPVNSSVTMDARFTLLPGDLSLVSSEAAHLDRRTFDLPPLGAAEVPLTLAGFIDAFDIVPSANSTLEVTERHGGALLQLPVQIPVYRTRGTANPLPINAHLDEWPNDTTIPAFGPMQIATRYLTRPELLAGSSHTGPQPMPPATARWTYDDHFLYALIQCPQPVVSDERNNDWPTQLGRWWGTDGIQLQIASAATPFPGKIIQLAFKPGGPMLGHALTFTPDHPLQISDTLPPSPSTLEGGGLKYAITLNKADGRIIGYTLEVAIPRAWFPKSPGAQPAWRINILRHRADTLTSASWSGPLVNDDDLAPMGLLIGEK